MQEVTVNTPKGKGEQVARPALAAIVMEGSMQYDQFGTLQSNFIISLLVGVVAGLDTADEAGRREFIAVARAVRISYSGPLSRERSVKRSGIAPKALESARRVC